MPVERLCLCRGCPGCGDDGACGDMTDTPVEGRCPRCSPFHQAREARRRAAKPQRKIWDSPRWKRVRELVCRRDGYRCVDCGRHREDLGSNEKLLADHERGLAVIMVEGGDPFDPRECQARCSTCSGRRDGGRPAAPISRGDGA